MTELTNHRRGFKERVGANRGTGEDSKRVGANRSRGTVTTGALLLSLLYGPRNGHCEHRTEHGVVI